jgi:DTW domain-containing protein YfiP
VPIASATRVRKLLHRNPFLQTLPRIGFTPDTPSGYAIRRAPAAHCWATVESVAYVLGALEGRPAAFATLLDPFRRMVAFQSARGPEQGAHDARSRSGWRAGPLVAAPPPLPR